MMGGSTGRNLHGPTGAGRRLTNAEPSSASARNEEEQVWFHCGEPSVLQRVARRFLSRRRSPAHTLIPFAAGPEPALLQSGWTHPETRPRLGCSEIREPE